MRFIDDAFPILVAMSGSGFDEDEMRAMVDGVEAYFRRNARFAVLSVSPGDFVRMGARERKILSDWVNGPRVRQRLLEAVVCRQRGRRSERGGSGRAHRFPLVLDAALPAPSRGDG